MIKLFFINLKIFAKRNKSGIIFFVLFVLGLIILVFLHVEIIYYFYPDILIHNLNELFEKDVYLTLSNNFTLLKGYIFSDPDFINKSALLSSSYGFVQYKKYIRHIKILRAGVNHKKRIINIFRHPLNKFHKYIKKKPLFVRFLYYTEKRNIDTRADLFKDLLKMSNFLQKLKLYFWEYTEVSNADLRKRRFYRRIYTLRTALHSFPAKRVPRHLFLLYYNKFNQHKLGFPTSKFVYREWNKIPNYNVYDIYKKFSKQIFINFFTDTIEPYRFYNVYQQKRKGPGRVFVDFLYDKETPSKNYYDAIYEGFYTEVSYPLAWWKDYKGFGKHKRFFENQAQQNRKYRFRFSAFYNEKFLFSPKHNVSRRNRIMIENILWKLNDVDFNAKTFN